MRIRNVRVLLFFAAAALCACHKDQGAAMTSNPAPTPQVAQKAPAAKKGPTVAEQTAGMVEAAVQGKSVLPANLKFELVQKPKVGQALDINLALIPHVDAGPASMKVNADEGLTLVPGGAQFELPEVAAEEVYRHTVSVTPTAEGLLIVGVTVSLKHDEVTDQKDYFIPVIAER